MPNASAPNAPWVAVCESPQTSVMPGCVTPCSGPMTWTMPRRRSPGPKYAIPRSPVWRASEASMARTSGSGTPAAGGVVGR